MKYGAWCMVYDVECMVHGVWCMVHSVARTVAGHTTRVVPAPPNPVATLEAFGGFARTVAIICTVLPSPD